MPAITNERLRQIVFDAQTDPTDKFIVLALEALLESQVGAGATDDILDTFLPEMTPSQTVMFGHKLGDYAGLDRATLKILYPELTDGNIDDIYTALGATSGTSVPNPFGAMNPEANSEEEKSEEVTTNPEEKASAKLESKPESQPQQKKAEEKKTVKFEGKPEEKKNK
jgi:hypothetical protein